MAPPAPPAGPPPPPSVPQQSDEDLLREFFDAILEAETNVLGAILNRDIAFGTPHIEKMSIDEMAQAGSGRVDYAVDVTFKEGLAGKAFMLFEGSLGLLIAELMMGNDGIDLPRKMDEIGESALIEAVNQTMGNACNNLGHIFETTVDFDSPMVFEVNYSSGIDLDLGEEVVLFAYPLTIDKFAEGSHYFVLPKTFADNVLFLMRNKGAKILPGMDVNSFAGLDVSQQAGAPLIKEPAFASTGPDLGDELLAALGASETPAPKPVQEQRQAPPPPEAFQRMEQPVMQPPLQAPQQMPQPQQMQPPPQAPQQMPPFQMPQQPGMGMPGMQQGAFGQPFGAQAYGQPYGMPGMGQQMPGYGMPGFGAPGMQPGMGFGQMQPQSPYPSQNVAPARFDKLAGERVGGATSNLDILLDVPLQITVELGRTTKTVRDVLELGAGTVVELDKLAGESVELLVNNRLIAKGEVVVIEENFGIRITSIVSPQERLESLK